MSLSMPTTSKPFVPNQRTASDPTSPADPVTMTTDIGSVTGLEPRAGRGAKSQHPEQVRSQADHLADAVDAVLIMHRNVGDRELQAGGAEQQFVIAPAILNAP